jgi:hypothetical protein
VTPEQATERADLHTKVASFIRAEDQPASVRDGLLASVRDYQRRWVPPYASFLEQQTLRDAASVVDMLPALPTDAFRFARISSLAQAEVERTFQSSGTTSDARSQHVFQDLTLYDLAAERAARDLLFPDLPRMRLVILAPTAEAMPSSSLSYMLSRFVTWFGTDASEHVFPDSGAEVQALLDALSRCDGPVALLGTSFAFVHAMDALGNQRFSLPPGSRIMQTGGFKGRSREVAPDAMRAALSLTFGVPEPFIVAEYGMTELSSQLYESTLRDAVLGLPMGPRRLLSPAWLRAAAIHPESLLPVAEGELGLVRLDDLANLDSVAAIQTADLARPTSDGLVLQGRAQGAVARGCSITADQLLSLPRP